MNESSHRLDYVEKVKVYVGDLRQGMFVCELDRPWLETPFALQGFEIRSDADVEALRKYCKHVFIDVLRTRRLEMTIDPVPPRSFLNEQRLARFDKEIGTAEATRKQTSIAIHTTINEIRFGKPVDVVLAKAAVAGCVASIMRNPDAMMFLTQLRNKDEYASQHAFNVCVYSIVLGLHAGFDTDRLEILGTCGLLHDMGTLAIPDRILHKEGRLSREEFAVVREHTTKGREILLAGHNMPPGTVEVAYAHHENLDGTGYPRGLEGRQLSDNCRIIAVVDRYDALISERPYRVARDHLDAVGILNRMAKENVIDDYFTSGLIGYLGIYPPGSVVELSSGEVAIVLESNPQHRLRPQILMVRDREGNHVEQYVDLAEKHSDGLGRPLKIKSMQRPDKYGIDLSAYRQILLESR